MKYIPGSGTLILKTSILFALLLLPVGTYAAGSYSSSDGKAEIHIAKSHAYADVFLNTDRYSGSVTIDVDESDVGKAGSLYLVALYGKDAMFMKTPGGWRRWDGSIGGLEPLAGKVLASEETLTVLEGQALLPGEYRTAAAYGVDGALIFTGSSLEFRVEDAGKDTLKPFLSNAAMEAYLKEGMQFSENTSWVFRSNAVAFAEGAASAGSVRVSTTNLQETGVDEADTIKNDGTNLYVLDTCDLQICLDVYSLFGFQALATPLAEYVLDTTVAPGGMYLAQDLPGSDMLVTLGGQNRFISWLDVWGWSGNTTEIGFFDADQADALQSVETLRIDGSLVSSRRVGNTLYVVTRFSPYIPDFIPLPLDKTEEEANDVMLEEATLEDLVPKVRDSADGESDLVNARDCYLPVSAVDRNNNPTMITVTGFSLDDPGQFSSVCFLGGTETLYMTTSSLYLATTQWHYDILGEDALVYSPEHTTAIHKFSLGDDTITYKGSGEVKGHLGWSEDKKSFRMGENGDYLNIVTSVGDTWNETSGTRLTVLKESSSGDGLAKVAVVDGIGKAGEQLYAARFLGDRAYLVTFRVIDPLYVIDLGDQEHPAIVGELEIGGYSDYLQPVGEDLLLGIGKDAVPDDGSFDFGGTRGAWYQGLKLSLFDVRDPASPREINSVVLGKRGTESEVLWDHHALSFIAASGSEPARLAVPVALHDVTPEWEGFDPSEPSAWYDYTHTGLYTFEITGEGITQAGRIISETGDGDDYFIALDDTAGDDVDEEPGTTRVVEIPITQLAPVFSNYSDRSVLLDDAVFYIHNGEVLTAFWGEDSPKE